MLDKFRETAITWDKANRKVYEPLRASAGDNKGRKLSVQVVNDGVIEDLSGASLSLFWETKDKAHKGLDAFTAVDATNGEFEIYYTTGMLSNEGTLNANFVLVDASGRIVSEPFAITVFKGIDDDAIQSSDSFTALTEALINISNLEQNYAPRLNNLTAQLQQTDEKKADIVYVDNAISSLTGMQIKASFPTLQLLQSTFPNGDEGIYFVESDVNRYIWDAITLSWKSIGSYDNANIINDSVGSMKINPSSISVNRFDKNKAVIGKFYSAGIGYPVIEKESALWAGILEPISVEVGSVVRFNKAFQNGYYVGIDDDGIVRQIGSQASTVSYKEVTVIPGVSKMYLSAHIDYLDEFMVTINNPMPIEYVPSSLKKTLDWLIIEPENLSDELQNEMGTLFNNPYYQTDGVICGDSIVDNVGENPTGTEVLIGYDGILIPKLGLNSLENIGISGRPMAEGTANGVGTHTTVTSADINWLTKKFFICNAGTNDFKLNVPIGEIQNMRVAFDTTTYIGAYQKMIEYVLNQNPNIEIVILTPAQRNNGRYSTETINSAGHKLIDYVNAAKVICQKYSGTLVDIYSRSGISEFKINAFTYDGLHFNNNGYKKAGDLTVREMLY